MKITFITYLVLSFTCSQLYSEQYLYLSNKQNLSIDQFTIDPDNGELTLVQQIQLNASPGTLSLSTDKSLLYTSLSTKKETQLATFSIGKNGHLKLQGKHLKKVSGGGVASNDNRFYIQYNYKQNVVSVLELKNSIHTGKLIQKITTTDHPHDISFSNNENLIFVPHNWENRLYQFSFNSETGMLTPLQPPYINGPDIEQTGYANFRSLALHPILNVFYCTYEKGGGLASLKYNSEGIKVWQNYSSIKKDEVVAASTVTLSPDNKFLFMSNRVKGAPGSIAVFKLSPTTGKILERIGVYENPAISSREIEVDTQGRFLYSSSKQLNSTLLFHIQKDGSLKFHKEFKIGGAPMLIIDR